MLTTENAGALVGASANRGKIKVRLKVDKGIAGEMKRAGDVVEVKPGDAAYLVQRKFAEYVK